MTAAQTEATVRLTVKEADESGDRPLTTDEMGDFVGDFVDQLEDDSRAIGPVVFGDAAVGTVEITFVLTRTISDRDTSTEVFDIIHDAGKALGCEWRNDPERKRASGRAPAATRKLARQSQQIEAAELVSV